MKLLRHEAVLFITALIFLLIISYSSPSRSDGIIAETPEENAVEYLININTADADELSLLDGIGPKLAERIINYREKHGSFSSLSELSEVSGIGASAITDIEDFATT